MTEKTKTLKELFQNLYWFNWKYDGRKKIFRNTGISKKEWYEMKAKAVKRRYIRTTAKDYVISPLRKAYISIKDWSKPEHGRYQKVAMYGNTWLYLCSPIYGHSDYNKVRILPIVGHEKQCEWLVKVSERIANGGKA